MMPERNPVENSGPLVGRVKRAEVPVLPKKAGLICRFGMAGPSRVGK